MYQLLKLKAPWFFKLSEYVKLPATWNSIPEDRILNVSAVEILFWVLNHSTQYSIFQIISFLISGMLVIICDYSGVSSEYLNRNDSFHVLVHIKWESSVGKVTGYSINSQFLIPDKGKNFSFHHHVQHRYGTHNPVPHPFAQWELGAIL